MGVAESSDQELRKDMINDQGSFMPTDIIGSVTNTFTDEM